ncbi:hypothetical protein HYV21_02050 [Candidatus Microgenomates bacterium]|nr:hypothetical protein [Candidatus Microgenomates bacterium]
MTPKEFGQYSEHLNQETKEYLRQVFTVCRYQAFALSVAGMSLGRSRLGILNELTIDTLRIITNDDPFLYEHERNQGIYEYLEEFQTKLKEGAVKVPEVTFSEQQRQFLTRLTVLLEWGWEIANEQPDPVLLPMTYHPIGMAIGITRDMLTPLVDREEVEKKFREIKDDSQKLRDFYDEFRLDVRFTLRPLPPQDVLNQ